MVQAVNRVDSPSPAHPPAHTPAHPAGRLYELDLLRFVAAAAVVFFHLGFLGSESTGPQPSDLLAPVAKYGYLGVDFFFILSGYVIARSALHRSAPRFTQARLVRLLPGYLTAVAATSVAVILSGDQISLARLAANITFTQRLFSQPFIDGAYWSLLIELHFYAIVAVLIATRLVSRLEAFAYAWLGITLVLRFLDPPAWAQTLVILPFAHLFVAGILFSALAADRRTSPARVVGLALCLAVGLIQATAQAEELTNATREFSPTVASVATASFFALFTLISLRGIPSLRRPAFATLGAASYPLYLLHQEIGYRVYDAWQGPFWVMFPVLFVLLTAASHLVSTTIEAPVAERFRRR